MAPHVITGQERPAPAPAATTQARAANAEQGKKLFISYGCYQCHGYEAQGSSATGPRLGPRPLPFAAFSRYVRLPSVRGGRVGFSSGRSHNGPSVNVRKGRE